MWWSKKDQKAEKDLAPAAELERYLALLQHGLVMIRNYGLAETSDEAQFCGLIADALHNLPDLLLHYSDFDQERFWQEIAGIRHQVPPSLEENWDAIFRRRQ